jgi:hypothetical protein
MISWRAVPTFPASSFISTSISSAVSGTAIDGRSTAGTQAPNAPSSNR